MTDATAAALRRKLGDGLPPVSAMFDPLRRSSASGNSIAAISDSELARLETDLKDASVEFDHALGARLPFPVCTPPLVGDNVKRLIAELTGADERLSVYWNDAAMPHDRDVESPDSLWVWYLLWERGDSIEVAHKRLHAIKADPSAGRAPRSGQTGHGLES